jgi:hypothetical protein
MDRCNSEIRACELAIQLAASKGTSPLQASTPVSFGFPLMPELSVISSVQAAAPDALPSVLEAACEMPAAPANCENSDPNLSKMAPEKKIRRLYNPARGSDALLEE